MRVLTADWFRRTRQRGEPMPSAFKVLATYNAEVSRGIPHTPEYDAQMAELQKQFDCWSEATP
jgi:hypothetical protein